jgi:acetyltransferase
MIVEQPWIKEAEANPLLASSSNLVALDARVVLHDPQMREQDLPRPAIRPYPVQYVERWNTKSGMEVTIRPIRPEDEPLMVKFHERLSERTVYLRYFQPLKLSLRTAHQRLTRICFLDYDREIALVAERQVPASGNGAGLPARREIIAVARLSKLRGTEGAECAVLVSDEYQHQGLGAELIRRLIQIARDERLKFVSSTMLAVNREMRAICNKLGFQLQPQPEDGVFDAVLRLE